MAKQTPGRNDPCWCGSGKKYKYCHLNRESDIPLQPWEASKRFRQAFSTKICLAPDAGKNKCRGKISRAHTVPKVSLKQIARNGHVYSFIPSLEKRKENQGRLVLELLGINKASTFTGFCARHDNAIFAPLEKKAFSGTSEQCFLLGYRALSMELYKKRAAIKATPSADQSMEPTFTQIYKIGLYAGAEETSQCKSRYDNILENGDFNTVEGYIIEFEAPPPVMCSGTVYPEQDFKGVELQDISNLSITPSLISFASFHGGKHGVVAFSWLSESGQACRQFIESLIDVPDQHVTGALLRFFFTHCENVHLNPVWWEALSQGNQDALIRRFNDSANPSMARPKSVLADDGLLYKPWTILNRENLV